MRMGFHCGLIYDDKLGNKLNAAVQPPRGMARGPRAHQGVLELGREEQPLPSQPGKQFSLGAPASILHFPSGGGRRGSPRGKWFKHATRMKRAEHQA